MKIQNREVLSSGRLGALRGASGLHPGRKVNEGKRRGEWLQIVLISLIIVAAVEIDKATLRRGKAIKALSERNA